MGRYEGCMESPWDDISIQYVLVCTHVAKKRYVEAFKEESQLVMSVILVFLLVCHAYNDYFFAGYFCVSLPKTEVGHYLLCSLY
jgi:hypothetical protein